MRRRLDVYRLFKWALLALPETVLTEIFYWHEIGLEVDDGLEFVDLLKKAKVLS